MAAPSGWEFLDVFASRGRSISIPAGESVDPDDAVLRFITSGGLGAFADADRLCVAWHPPGSVQGLRHLLHAKGRPVVEAILDTTFFEIRAASVGMKDDCHLVRLGGARLDFAEREMACIDAHSVDQRLAKWIRRLIRAAPPGPLPITQERLAQIIGVQRTSVNAALHTLKKAGVMDSRRGRVRVHMAQGLAALACDCDAAAVDHDPAVMADRTSFAHAHRSDFDSVTPQAREA